MRVTLSGQESTHDVIIDIGTQLKTPGKEIERHQ
jgi:hypothetical protein